MAAVVLAANANASTANAGGPMTAADTLNPVSYSFFFDEAWGNGSIGNITFSTTGARLRTSHTTPHTWTFTTITSADWAYEAIVYLDGSSNALTINYTGTVWLSVPSGSTTLLRGLTVTATGADKRYYCGFAGGEATVSNCTFSGVNYEGPMFYVSSGQWWFEAVTATTTGTSNIAVGFADYFAANGVAFNITLIDCAMSNGGGASTAYLILYRTNSTINLTIAGATTWNGLTCIPTNWSTNKFWNNASGRANIIRFFSKVTSTVTGGATPAVSIVKSTQTTRSNVLYRRFGNGYKDGGTLTNVNVCYALAVVSRYDYAYNGADGDYINEYISDQNNAETGDNTTYKGAAQSLSGSFYGGVSSAFWAIPTSGTYATGVAVAITLTAVPTIPLVSFNDYSNVVAGTKTWHFGTGSTVYFGSTTAGGVTSSVGVTGATIQTYVESKAGVKQGADLINGPFDLVAATEKTYYAMNSNVLLSKASLPDGEYSLVTIVSGGTPAITSETSRTNFSISSTPEMAIDARASSDGTDPLWIHTTGATVKLIGSVTSQVAVTGATLTIAAYNDANVKQGADLLSASVNLAAATPLTHKAANGGTDISKAGLIDGSFYFLVTISGGTPAITSESSRAEFVLATIGGGSTNPNLDAGTYIGGSEIGGA
jgi:hypothetical protein